MAPLVSLDGPRTVPATRRPGRWARRAALTRDLAHDVAALGAVAVALGVVAYVAGAFVTAVALAIGAAL